MFPLIASAITHAVENSDVRGMTAPGERGQGPKGGWRVHSLRSMLSATSGGLPGCRRFLERVMPGRWSRLHRPFILSGLRRIASRINRAVGDCSWMRGVPDRASRRTTGNEIAKLGRGVPFAGGAVDAGPELFRRAIESACGRSGRLRIGRFGFDLVGHGRPPLVPNDSWN